MKFLAFVLLNTAFASLAFGSEYKTCATSQKSFAAAENRAVSGLIGARDQRDENSSYFISQTVSVKSIHPDDTELLEWKVCFTISDKADPRAKPDEKKCTTTGFDHIDGVEHITRDLLQTTPPFFPKHTLVGLSRSHVFSSDTYDNVRTLHVWQCLDAKKPSPITDPKILCGTGTKDITKALSELQKTLLKEGKIGDDPVTMHLDLAAIRSELSNNAVDWRVCAQK